MASRGSRVVNRDLRIASGIAAVRAIVAREYPPGPDPCGGYSPAPAAGTALALHYKFKCRRAQRGRTMARTLCAWEHRVSLLRRRFYDRPQDIKKWPRLAGPVAGQKASRRSQVSGGAMGAARAANESHLFKFVCVSRRRGRDSNSDARASRALARRADICFNCRLWLAAVVAHISRPFARTFPPAARHGHQQSGPHSRRHAAAPIDQ